MRSIAVLVFAALTCACASSPNGAELASQIQPRTVWVVGGEGRAIGQATFTEAPSGVLIRLEFSERALSSGWHGLHLHQRGDCSDFAAGFQASGSHVGMDRRVQHGLLSADGPEAGDLPNLHASPTGAFGAEIFSPWITLAADPVGPRPQRQPLLDADGTALVIHAGADDHLTQPIGGAGARIACAALTPLP
jgi:Cu-Zn family superoxide dismutase